MRFVTWLLGLVLLASSAAAQQYPIRIRTGVGVESNSAATASDSGYMVLPDGGRLVPISAPATEAATAEGELWLTDGAPPSNSFCPSCPADTLVRFANSTWSAVEHPLAVHGPGVATTGNTIVRWTGSSGLEIKGSTVTVADNAAISNILAITGISTNPFIIRGGSNQGVAFQSNSTVHGQINMLFLDLSGAGNAVLRAAALGSTAALADGGNTQRVIVKDTSKHVQIVGDLTASGWLGYGTAQQAETLGPGAATVALTKSYVVIAADAGTNTLTTATCTGCQEGDEVEFHKSGANGLNFSASGTGANQFARACDMSAADSTSRWRRSEGGYWRLMSCVP